MPDSPLYGVPAEMRVIAAQLLIPAMLPVCPALSLSFSSVRTSLSGMNSSLVMIHAKDPAGKYPYLLVFGKRDEPSDLNEKLTM